MNAFINIFVCIIDIMLINSIAALQTAKVIIGIFYMALSVKTLGHPKMYCMKEIIFKPLCNSHSFVLLCIITSTCYIEWTDTPANFIIVNSKVCSHS